MAGRPRRRGLSERRVKRLVRVNQHWTHASGRSWRVAGIHPEDGHVELSGQIRGTWIRLFVTYAELGRDYQLEEPAR